MPTRHESGWLKQSNKGHKQNFRSKRDVSKALGGRVGHAASVSGSVRSNAGGSSAAALNRTARTLRAAALRKNKRQALLQSRRIGGSSIGGSIGGAPRTVGIVYLCEHARAPALLGDQVAALQPGVESITEVFAKEKFRATFLIADRSPLSVLDVAKVADLLCFVLPLGLPETPGSISGRGKRSGALENYLEGAVDELGRKFITIAKAQGLPAVVGIVQNLEQAPRKLHNSLKKQAVNFFGEEFGEGTKVVVDEDPSGPSKGSMDVDADSAAGTQSEPGAKSLAHCQFLRAIMETRLKHISWRSERSYMLACSAEPRQNGELAVSGYLRGLPLNVHQLIHVPDHGNFRIARIEIRPDPNPLKVKARQGTAPEQQQTVVISPDPARLLEIEEEAAPDTMAGEQTWPTADEMEASAQNQGADESDEARAARKLAKKRAKLPAGTSDMQAAWLMGISDDEDEDGEEEDADEDDKDGASEASATMDDELMAEGAGGGMTLKEWKEKQRMERDELDFPDEVDTPEDIPARERFARYRGLKSFRTSPWHPKESLPREYARIFQLENPIGLQNQVMEEARGREAAWLGRMERNGEPGPAAGPSASQASMDVESAEDRETRELVDPGQFVTIVLAGADAKLLQAVKEAKLPLVLGALLDHENKLSVINCTVTKAQTYEKPVKARDPVVLSCGIWRRTVRPTYSDNAINCDKHKFERFLHASRWCVATMYAPVTFGTNVPTLLLDPTDGELVASGSLLSIDPDRVVLKKVVISGFPIRVKKSWAVVRYMFYNPEDIRWFKPIDLWTKHGMSGRILEPLGTHGLFKCSFSRPIKSNDTICMSLYKRVFPKPVGEFRDLQEERRAEAI